MKYQVIKDFMDLKDRNYMYKAGDTYPRDGSEPTEERIAELSGSKNRRKQPLISEVEESEPQKEAEEPAAEPTAEPVSEAAETEEPTGEAATDETEEPAAEAEEAEPEKTTTKKTTKKES